MPRLSKLLPQSRDGRTLSAATFVHSIGFGSFAASSAIFFTRSAGLTVAEVGTGTAIAGFTAVAAALLAGRLADRVGARELMVFLSAVQAVLFTAYTVVHSFGLFLAVICTLTAADHGARVARSTVIAGLASGGDRVALRAHLRSVSKLGVSLGTVVAAVPLQLDTRPAYVAVIVCNAVASAATALLGARLPRRSAATAPTTSASQGWVALRDGPYMSVALVCGLLATYRSLLTIALPLWVANYTEAPDVVVAALFVGNTVLSVALQVPASRRAKTATAAGRTARLGARLVAPACALFALAAMVPARPAMLLLAVGVVALTAGELWTSVAAWSLSFELADSRVPGQYQGAFALGMSIEAIAGPLLATGLVLGFGVPGWLAAGALFAVLGTVVAAATRRALGTRPVVADPTTVVSLAAPTVRLAQLDPARRMAHTQSTADPTTRLAYADATADLLHTGSFHAEPFPVQLFPVIRMLTPAEAPRR
jgi:MFS family permease